MDVHSASSAISSDNGAIAINNSQVNATTLTNINEDCLRHILNFLGIVDVVNVALTCKNLKLFATAEFIPKMAKHIRIDEKFRLSESATSTTISDLVRYFHFFGRHVKHLTLLGLGYTAKVRSECLDTFKTY